MRSTIARPGRDRQYGGQAIVDDRPRRWRSGPRGETPQVPRADFSSYYGRPVLRSPVWGERDIASYLFLGGLAGGSSLLGFGADRCGLPALARNAQLTAAGAIGLSGVALVHDLGRPKRFANMLRTFKVTSPMSVGSWLLAAYGPAAAVAALGAVTGTAPRVSGAARLAAAALGPAVASYTAVLLADTAVPAWHDARATMPFVFVASAATAAGGAALVTTPRAQSLPATRLGVLGAAAEIIGMVALQRRSGAGGDAYTEGRAATFRRAGSVLAAGGAVVAGLAPRRRRAVQVAAGLALMAGSACTRLAVFRAGVQSTRDPRFVVVPQRQRLDGHDDAS